MHPLRTARGKVRVWVASLDSEPAMAGKLRRPEANYGSEIADASESIYSRRNDGRVEKR